MPARERPTECGAWANLRAGRTGTLAPAHEGPPCPTARTRVKSDTSRTHKAREAGRRNANPCSWTFNTAAWTADTRGRQPTGEGKPHSGPTSRLAAGPDRARPLAALGDDVPHTRLPDGGTRLHLLRCKR